MCPECRGDEATQGSCKRCHGHGCEVVTCCPYEAVSDDVRQGLEFVRIADAGTPPAAGGSLNQTRWFLSLWDLVRLERAKWDAKQLK